jgi:hypothetical protein
VLCVSPVTAADTCLGENKKGHELISKGSKITIFRAAYALLRIMYDRAITDAAFVDLIHFLTQGAAL